MLVIFLNGDPRFPMVVGGLWNGQDQAPDSLPGDRVDRWTITGKAGTKISIVEEQQGQEKIVFHTPGGVTGTLTDEAGGKITLEAVGNTVTMETSGVTIRAAVSFKQLTAPARGVGGESGGGGSLQKKKKTRRQRG